MITIIILGGVAVLIPLVAHHMHNKKQLDKSDINDKEHLIIWLDHQIYLKENQLNRLISEVADYNTRPDINLSPMESRVLNAYEQSNIRIPVDIIEDLKHARLQNEVDIYYFIENARLEWKTECAKKVMKNAKKGRSI